MKLSIVIVSWNTKSLLVDCLHSIQAEIQGCSQAELLPHEIECFVVDNSSTDGTLTTLHQDFPWVQTIVNDHNVGYAKANNQAIAQCSGEYILLLNPDTLVCTGLFVQLISFMEQHPNVGACGPRLLNSDLSLQPSCYPAPTLARESWRLLHLDHFFPYGSYRMAEWSLTTPRRVDIVQGACLLVRHTVIQTVGAFDEDYFMYTEEVDLCYRIRAAGWLIYWLPASQVVHFGGQSAKQVPAEMFIQLYRSKVIYFRKHFGERRTQLYKVLLYLSSLLRLLVYRINSTWRASPSTTTSLALHYRSLMTELRSM